MQTCGAAVCLQWVPLTLQKILRLQVLLSARDFLALNTDPQQRYYIANIRAHPWFNLVQQDRSPGILVGNEQILVDHS
jgi:hypothetical protein